MNDNDNEKPLDLEAVEARLAAVKHANYEFGITIVARDVDLPGLQALYANAPNDIAALVGEVRRLRAHVFDLQKIALAAMAQESQDLGLYDYYPEEEE